MAEQSARIAGELEQETMTLGQMIASFRLSTAGSQAAPAGAAQARRRREFGRAA